MRRFLDRLYTWSGVLAALCVFGICVLMLAAAFGRLPKDQQDGILKAAAAAEPRGWDMSKQRERDADEMLAKNGISVQEPSAELKSALGKIGEQMAAEWEKSAGADGQAILKAYKGK